MNSLFYKGSALCNVIPRLLKIVGIYISLNRMIRGQCDKLGGGLGEHKDNLESLSIAESFYVKFLQCELCLKEAKKKNRNSSTLVYQK